MIEAVIFDMDGLLIDSEPLWRQAEKAAFRKVGIELSDDDCKLTMGNRSNEVVDYWYNLQPWQEMTTDELEKDIISNVTNLIAEKGEQMEGVNYILDFFKNKGLKTAIASSSPKLLIDVVLNKLGIVDSFDVILSAEFEEFGKPHPAVFLSTAKKLNVKPDQCLVFEDSVNGLLAAKSAGMSTVVIPDKENKDDIRFDAADVKLYSLLEFTTSHFEKLG